MAFASRTMILALAGVLAPLLAGAQGKSELRGRVVSETGAAIAGATITLAQIGYTIRTDSSGAFLLAGTPGSTLVFTLRAAGFRGDTAAVTLPRRAGLSQEFKLVSEATAPSEPNPSDRVLRGSVVDFDGRALAYASVQVNGGRRYLSDDSGRFTIPPPAGRFSLLVRRIGFEPLELRLSARPDSALRIVLKPIATQLKEVSVVASGAAYRSLDIHDFYGRMRDAERGINYGYFVTPEDLERRKPNWVTQMAEALPSVRILGPNCGPRGAPGGDTICGVNGCKMTVYLDNIRIVGRLRGSDDAVNGIALPTHVAAMEIYPRGVTAPPQYQSQNGTCGVVLIWTK